jgi:hypothetical protein
VRIGDPAGEQRGRRQADGVEVVREQLEIQPIALRLGRAGEQVSSYMIAAAVQQMIRDDQAAASFATIDAEIAADTAGSGKVA